MLNYYVIRVIHSYISKYNNVNKESLYILLKNLHCLASKTTFHYIFRKRLGFVVKLR